ncbi:MAG: hypothetical protein ACRDFX_01970 [Chloroflexota bacterium]
MSDEPAHDADNRERKVAGRNKRRLYVQGTRAYTHAITNSIVKRARRKRAGKQSHADS